MDDADQGLRQHSDAAHGLLRRPVRCRALTGGARLGLATHDHLHYLVFWYLHKDGGTTTLKGHKGALLYFNTPSPIVSICPGELYSTL